MHQRPGITSPVHASTTPYADVVARLRAAGCVFAEDEADLLLGAAHTPEDLAAMLERRVAGVPLEHVLGWAEFCGLRIIVDSGVFVPRRRTELLVREAARLIGPGAVVVDLCCGSGAVGLAVVDAIGHAELHAVDVDPAAARCARKNVEAVGGRVYQGNLFEPLPTTLRGRVDVLVACTPYVPTGSVRLLPPEARLHEPQAALDGGPDGLDVVRLVADDARGWLEPGGHVLVETSEDQAAEAARAFSAHGLVPRVARSEDQNGTVVIGSAPEE